LTFLLFWNSFENVGG